MDEHKKRPLDNPNSVDIESTKKSRGADVTDRSFKAVIVKNLPRSYNNGKIKKIFQDCGSMQNIETCDSIDHASRFARLEFSSHNEALAALTKTYKKIGSNEIEVKLLQDSTLWMTNFPPNYSNKNIRNLLLNIGIAAISIRLPSHRYNSNRRFCYIDVYSKEECETAAEKLNGIELGHYKLVVKISNPAEKEKRSDAGLLERRELFVRNLNPSSLEKDHLQSIFGKFGTIEHITIPKSSSDINNGCAFITFLNKEDTDNALSLNKTEIDERIISVQLADNKAYLERKELLNILNSRNQRKKEFFVSIYPISDKISKEHILAYISENLKINSGEVTKIFLANDLNGALVHFSDRHIAAKCCVKLDKTKFMNKMIHVGTISDLKSYKIDTSQRESNHTISSHKDLNILLKQNEPKDNTQEYSPSSTSKPEMTNDDFRKMFVGN
ncbi:similar to Saccharomyces cerevisiae YMR268C PRP24 Splicing factor that reanneals U4 and U6 snRNPs during spliceosome recycling [Maudiozyma barnettii]|uniref:U4/U6 snRNA-associated-splicing factor PRP24 n=1 Tax=Maudiozyma barnettii TaxID=61262 RepID=A0A8H2ZFS9_9SACH|nr:U6 snRNP complex subunit PRP24 [Kazachstania barnettii]CAB4252634.1 similar to Saccharomyces cerevisiae YMR268C PRP24 Splicing factor that reanneals U4 and U6 snRNPs during spliceosome recycling [Kazachstania barnettii]CAD1780106.1 similar to Saccharomyces cerevisiae YMR268C PRP24 Splicing factor that reanneals U4 and U6 snRNPs during spliceosome recycling [Kazachstania barnettii]